MMPKANCWGFLFYVLVFCTLLAETLEESFVEDLGNKDNQAKKGIETDEHERETDDNKMADVYDDYVKVLIFEEAEFRAALRNKDQLWENGIVPYEISNDYNKENRKLILEAMRDFHNKTCIRFRRRRREKSYISIVPGSGCSAVVGKIPDRSNPVRLHENCFVKGIVIHELMHALGFFHEQNRPDRDDFVTIVYSNILKGSEANFDKRSSDAAQTFNLTYDFNSVMHYGMFDFAVNKSEPTIIVRENGTEIGQRKGFSEKDLIKINRLYNCDEKKNSTKATEEKRVADEDDEDDSDEGKKSERPKGHRWFSLLKLLGK